MDYGYGQTYDGKVFKITNQHIKEWLNTIKDWCKGYTSRALDVVHHPILVVNEDGTQSFKDGNMCYIVCRTFGNSKGQNHTRAISDEMPYEVAEYVCNEARR